MRLWIVGAVLLMTCLFTAGAALARQDTKPDLTPETETDATPGATPETVQPCTPGVFAPLSDIRRPRQEAADQFELNALIDYIDAFFAPERWRIVSAEESRTSSYAGVRLLEDEAVLFFFTLYHFDCGVFENTIADYFSQQAFEETLLVNYAPFTLTDECSDEDIRLWEFETSEPIAGRSYVLRYWVLQTDVDRVLAVNGVAPVEFEMVLDEFGVTLFNRLSSCAALDE